MTPNHLRPLLGSVILAAGLALSGCGDDAGNTISFVDDPVDTAPPAVPANVEVAEANDGLMLSWSANAEADFAHYVLQRSMDRGATWQSLSAAFTDTSYADGYSAEVDYRVSAVDSNENQSAFAKTSFKAPSWGGPKDPIDPSS